MCGIFGIISRRPIAESIYHGLIQLQHRGQDAAGIFTYDLSTDKHALHKDLGLVKDIFTTDTLPLPNAGWGIGHVRYSTIGKGDIADTQPLYVHGRHTIAMAHNGNIVNYVPLRKELEAEGTLFETACDLEAILHLFAASLPPGNLNFAHICHAVETVYRKVSGAYSVIAVIGGFGVLAFRDPWGIRPLLIGREENSYAFSSETNPLNVFGCREIADIQPGEAVFIDAGHRCHRKVLRSLKTAHCSFEYNYFSKPNSEIDKREVYQVRKELGKALGRKIKASGLPIDIVTPIPTTARTAAIGLAEALEAPYEEGFVKQDNIGRTFIMPTQGIRQNAMNRKLAPVLSVFKDKAVLLVDDSIVRGTVSKRAVDLARWAGAAKVYFASTFPPIRHPCHYGIDFPDRNQLIAAGRQLTEIQSAIGADALFYNEVAAFLEVLGEDNLCTACLTGKYPTCTEGMADLQNLRNQDLNVVELACKQ